MTIGRNAAAAGAVVAAVAACQAAVQTGGVAEGTVAVDGATLYYRTVGAGAPVVVVHGGPGMDHSYLRPGMDALADRVRLIYYDQRGSGRTEGSIDSTAVTFDRFVSDIDALRAALGYDRIHVMAHSWGGLLGMRYALDYPGRIATLILMGTVEPGSRFAAATSANQRRRRNPEDAATIAALLATEEFARRDRETVNEIYRLSFRSTFADPARADRLVIDFNARTTTDGGRVAGMVMGPLADLDWWDELAALRVPTLIVHGDADPTPVEVARALSETLPAAELVVIDSAGHFPFLEQPDATFDAISRFVTRSSP